MTQARPAAWHSPFRAHHPLWTVATAIVAAIVVAGTTIMTSPAASGAPTGGLAVSALRANGLVDPLGTTTEPPILSWQSESSSRAVMQTAYQVRVAADAASLGSTDIWNSGVVTSDEQLNVAYDGPALDSESRYYWQVKVWGTDGAESAWSDPAWFETALNDASDWDADWIGGTDDAAQLALWTNYTVSVDFTLDNLVMGLYARAENLNNAYMWQLSVADGTARLRPHKKVNGNFSLIENKDISSFTSVEELTTGSHNMTVMFDGDQITTELDGVVIDTRTDSTLTRGYVGFRESVAAEGSEEATIHAVTVTSKNGDVLLDTDFTDGNPFSAGTLTDAGLKLSNVEAIYRLNDADPLLRKEFSVSKTVASARVYATAEGVYELRLNGDKVGNVELAPGWTDYNIRLDYQTYDVTEMLREGDNVFGGLLSDGWYAGRIASFGDQHWGTEPALLAQMRIDYTDGSHEWVKTDASWSTTSGPYVAADLLDGESYDARRDQSGWDSPGFDASEWTPVHVSTGTAANLLEPQSDQPVRMTEELTPVSRTEAAPDTWIYDMGQNMVGVASMDLTGVAGSTATIRYGEMLNPDGTLYTANLRSAKVTDHFTFAEDGTTNYAPKFTFHGYQYLEITGVSEPPTVDQVTGLVWGTDLPTTGTLTTSSDMLNQLQSNIVWGQRGNFLSIPTDTPARDERLGWTGDINVFAPTASFNQDTLAFLGKWLVDLEDAQGSDGNLPGVAPMPTTGCCGGGTGWSDAAVTVPYTLWQTYGDTAVIRDSYDMMSRFMDFVETSTGPSLIRQDGGYGDWLHLDDPTDARILGTAYYSYIADQMSQMAGAIGADADAAHYAQLSADVKVAFADAFIASDGTVQGNSQAGYALAIGMGLVPEDQLEAVGNKFVAKIASRDNHLSTGFLGTPWLLPALTASGHQDVAYMLLNNDTYPSWGYEVASGATTMWERWNSLQPDGSFGPVGMNSFNHYAYGAVGDWMYQNIGGISATSAGYKTFDVAPSVGGGLTEGQATFESVYGTIESNWNLTDAGMTMDVKVPVNTTATVKVPALNRWEVTEGGAPLDEANGVIVVDEGAGVVTLEVGSGTYAFESSATNSGVIVDLDGAGDVLPGETAHGTITVTNPGSSPLVDFVADIAISSGFDANPATVVADRVPASSHVELPFEVDIPQVMAPGNVDAVVTVSVTVAGQSRSFDINGRVATVNPGVNIEDLTATASSDDGPDAVTVDATVTNRTDFAITGHLAVDQPDGWPSAAASSDVTIAPGDSATVQTVVVVPMTLTAGDQPLAVQFVSASTALASGQTSASIKLATPPATHIDHVDLGESGSESAHNVQTSGDGGTTTEAGLTRRYSGIDVVGSWFSFDLEVTPNEPFLIRAIETFDGDQVKSYDILVNDALVNERLYQRTATDAGLATYQVLVPDDGTLTSTGKVTIKMRYNGVGEYDPSVADVWTVGVPADTAAPLVSVDVSHPGDNGWYLAGAEATITAIDARSDVASSEFALGDDAWQTYSGPITLPEGDSTVHYRATDSEGNISADFTRQVRVDSSAPTVWGWLTEAGAVQSFAQDGGSTVDGAQYSVDGAAWVTGLSTFLAQHVNPDSLWVRAQDDAGNVSDPTQLTPMADEPTLTVVPGQSTLVVASGFEPDDSVTVELHSDPIVLGTATADVNGVVTVDAVVPADFDAGAHTLVFVVASDPSDGDGAGSGDGADDSAGADGAAGDGADDSAGADGAAGDGADDSAGADGAAGDGVDAEDGSGGLAFTGASVGPLVMLVLLALLAGFSLFAVRSQMRREPVSGSSGRALERAEIDN